MIDSQSPLIAFVCDHSELLNWITVLLVLGLYGLVAWDAAKK